MTANVLIAAGTILALALGAFFYAVAAAAKLPKRPKREAAPQPESRPRAFVPSGVGSISFHEHTAD